jgi:hypothetical protein
MHISKTVEMTISEQEEVDAVLGNIVQSDTEEDEADDGEEDDGDDNDNSTTTSSDTQETGGAFYVVDPNTGELKDPTTGQAAEIDDTFEEDIIDIGDNSVTVTQ